jgi:hypothetical protein
VFWVVSSVCVIFPELGGGISARDFYSDTPLSWRTGFREKKLKSNEKSVC